MEGDMSLDVHTKSEKPIRASHEEILQTTAEQDETAVTHFHSRNGTEVRNEGMIANHQ
jgi:hypothetical protein